MRGSVRGYAGYAFGIAGVFRRRLIKLLPAVPDDLSKGSVKGVWLYTFAKIESMEWDMKAGKADAEISSLEDQEIHYLFPVGYRKVFVDGKLYAETVRNLTLK